MIPVKKILTVRKNPARIQRRLDHGVIKEIGLFHTNAHHLSLGRKDCGYQFCISPICDNILKPSSKRVHIILRRKPNLQEPDGAVFWPGLMRRQKHDLGISTSGWTRYQLHQTRSDLNVALTQTENLNTSDGYMVTEAHQEFIQTFSLVTIPYVWKVYIYRT